MRKKASDPKTFWGPVPDRDAILNLEPVILLEDAEDYFGRDYHGDSFDERLCQIYTMVRNAGGVSALFPYPLACTERLENWTSMWIQIGREGSSQPEGEAREVIDQLVRVWGHQLRLPHVDDARSPRSTDKQPNVDQALSNLFGHCLASSIHLLKFRKTYILVFEDRGLGAA
ncbi:hypothetical protein P167DRAFT_574282 [Morchella conica CCBAS932]|uniref:Uncharacterized protein n=1 Tax=Morchella conica CCBAS932 TaxID=1392247 RepID=A0A3N4KPS6_9PEZI|nr:hypothetical protein P167DRAFT_574282 [Morchella conica CCBAS932]